MTIGELKGCVCEFFNSVHPLGIPLVKSPTNNKAPKGNYIAVGVEQVEAYSNGFTPPAGDDVRTYPYIATMYFVEVEGDGDYLRSMLNGFSSDDFLAYAREKGFTVWDPSSLIKVDTYDGEFYVRQWRFTCRMNFTDSVAVSKPSILTVDASYDVDEEF